ncbi:amino acid aminotransferase [Motiliproteus sp. MSK22-1]|uniref:amino acid aminotransferase n=1 Tax=Motiliproteus sp. MSK22-1 TaxID=1897630 RepID=UPI000978320D|nr:amino acid aminotransferase [Motiliproteus sp. MSK22-1]OMH31710.1 aromatic amino acid aminotransferase [Motiliproteus sp. MSK22-1]
MFEKLDEPRLDPIISLMSAYREDLRAEKMDLGIGVYRNDEGITPVMSAVKKAEQELMDNQLSKGYVGLAGDEAFNQSMIDLLLGGTAAEMRASALQTPGASGALRLLGELMYQANPKTTIWVSNPSYVNHQPVMEAAGLKVAFYPYFDPVSKQLDTEGMMSCVEKLGPDDVLLLHGCCHNPTGVDIELSHWQMIAEMSQKQGFLPFVDIAYQGFGDGLEADRAGLKILADNVDELLVATSCSKNFGLYRERTGAAVLVGKTKSEAVKARGLMFEIARATYTMPPDHGAAVVTKILSQPELKTLWEAELNQMLARIKDLRTGLVEAFNQATGDNRFDYFGRHRGMFSMTGLSAAQANALREDHGIYIVGDGRVNVAGLQKDQIDYLVKCFLAIGA